eukprot:gene26501-biopygen16691
MLRGGCSRPESAWNSSRDHPPRDMSSSET